MKYFVITYLLLLFIISCNSRDVKEKQEQFEDQTYVYLFFESEEACMEAQDPEFFMNCHQQLDFLEDGMVEIMLSDIIWRGEYKVEGKKVILDFDLNQEIPGGEVIFEIIDNSSLKRLDNGTIWKKVQGESIWR